LARGAGSLGLAGHAHNLGVTRNDRSSSAQPIATAESIAIEVDDAVQVSGLLRLPVSARALFVVAHGAGAGMRHAFLASVAEELNSLGIASLRYQFPYMESGRKRPDPPALCHATVRAAVCAAGRRVPGMPLIAGGKSFGGRMTSQAQAAEPLPGVRGLAFLGFPLHPPRQPSDARAAHLAQVFVPMLFLQGSRDEFAQRPLLEPVLQRLGSRTRLSLIEGADHSFHVPARSGRTDAEVLRAALSTLASWIDSLDPKHGGNAR
jgi:predicted alpha/beta-hydrolase family hydrolase